MRKCQKRPILVSKENYPRPCKEQKRPPDEQKRPTTDTSIPVHCGIVLRKEVVANVLLMCC
jgi:hypothetical protein